MYAIVKVGGKQYRVEKGDSLLVDRMPDDEGATVRLKPLLLAPDGKDAPVFGQDALAKVKVEAKVAGHLRGPKIHVLKFKPKQGYKRRQGHRSELTRLEIGDIELLGGRKSPAPKKAAAPKGKDDGEKVKAAEPKAKAEKPKTKADKPNAKAGEGEGEGKGKGTEAEKQESGSKKVQGDKLEEATKASPTTEKSGKPESEEPAAPEEDSSDGS